MKKLIAISLVLTLVAGAAFAELTIGGQAGLGVTVISGDNGDNSVLGVNSFKPETGNGNGNWGQGHGGRIDASYTNDEGTFGAFVRVKPPATYASGTDRVFAWWQPLSLLKLTLGVDGNGQFGINYIVGWGWHANDAEDFVAWHGYGFTRNAWSYGGWDTFGAVLTLTPIEGLAINVAVPYDKTKEAAEVYNHMVGQLTYDIADIGQIGITYTSGAGYRDWGPGNDDMGIPPGDGTYDPGAVHGQFYLTAVESLQLNIGLKYTLSGKIGDVTITPAIGAGFGLNYNISDTIGVKARLAASFAGSFKANDTTLNDPLKLGFDLMPYFDLGILKLFLNLGIEYTDKKETYNMGNGEVEKEDDSQLFKWYVNPYITKSAGGGTFYAGFQLYSDGKAKDAVIGWGIPIGIQIGF
ncbi:MAG: hypothetical protein LBH75_00035 [Treponema sp.]|nr:hypothetical protein [Treponema sp.]